MKLTWNSPNYLTLQSEIQLFLEIARFLPTFWREATNPVLRTFDSGRSPFLIVDPATRLDKRGERCTDGIRDGVVATSSIFVYNVVTKRLNTYFTRDDYVVNIIIKVMYFSQGCATHLYGSAILSLSFYYILLI